MDEAKLKALMQAFAMESRLAARAEIMALAARAGKEPHLAAAFEAAMASRQVRAKRLLRLMRAKTGKGKTALLAGFAKDCEQSAAVYKHNQGLDIHALEQGGRVDGLLPGLIRRAADMEPGHDSQAYAVCRICGFVRQGEAPPKCPVCGAMQSKFQGFGKPGD